MTFNHYHKGSIPLSLMKIFLFNDYKLMVDCSSSKRSVSIRIRLVIIQFNRVSNLIGKGFSCRENRYRIKTDLTRLFNPILRKSRYR